jgi:hypothetical protein
MKKKQNPIHGIKTRGFLEKKWPVEMVSNGPGVLASGMAAYKAAAEPGLTWLAWVAGVVCVWTLGSSMLKVTLAKRQDAKDDELRNHDGLAAALHVLHAAVAGQAGLTSEEKDDCLRVTFHRVLPPLGESDHIEQIVPYVGGGGGGAGRKFPIRSGITGKAILQRAVFVMDRKSESYEDYKKELVSDWHYTDHDVKNITSDRFSAMAVPVKSSKGEEILGVVYLDAKGKNFFASNEMRDTVIKACSGIARYTGERYV